MKGKKCPLQVNDVRAVYQGTWLNDQVADYLDGKYTISFISSTCPPEYIDYRLCTLLANRRGPEIGNPAIS